MKRKNSLTTLLMGCYELRTILCVGNNKFISQGDIFRKLKIRESNGCMTIILLERKGFLLKKKMKKIGYSKNYYFLSKEGKKVFNCINEIRRLNQKN